MIFINLITVNDAKYIINICILELMYIYRVSDNFAHPKWEGKLAQIKKESPLLFCDLRKISEKLIKED